MKRILLTIMFASILVGCGGDNEKVAYRPIAFGQDNQCYYVNDPLEAELLMQQGLCQRSWAPTVMPMAWHQMYYPYYSSPAYYRVYVPAATRTVYVERERTYGSQNKKSIDGEAKRATYQGSNGKTVTAEKIGVAKYGSGNRFGPTGTKFGGGSRNATTPEPARPGSKPEANPTSPTPAPAPKAPAPKVTSPTPKPKASAGTKSGGPKPSGGYKPSGGSKSGGYGGGSRSGGGYGGGSRR